MTPADGMSNCLEWDFGVSSLAALRIKLAQLGDSRKEEICGKLGDETE
jgi:hypothetical protein